VPPRSGGAAKTGRPAQSDRPVRPSTRPGPAGPVRLTRRGRVVLAGLAITVGAVALCLLSLAAASGAQAASHGAARAGYRGMRQVVVDPGQTLWSIASAAEPAADPRAVIQQIIEANSLAGGTIQAGQVLWVPKG
jgi:hypothetical protein